MTEQMSKATLLAAINSGYTDFEALLATLSREQLTTKGVNGEWSVKDNVAHLNAWHRRLLVLLQAVHDNREPVAFLQEGDMDEINEQVYQENKSRSLDDVMAEFRTSYQQIVESVQAMSDEELNRPLVWGDNQPIWPWIDGNTYGHYQEHSQIIRNWLNRNASI